MVVEDLFGSSMGAVKLDILVFGPAVTPLSQDEGTRNLQLKRQQIKNELLSAGHNVNYAEDVVDPGLSAPINNAALQEIILMEAYDLIVVLVGSPGANAETGMISARPKLAAKASLFIDDRHLNGLVASCCQLAVLSGGAYESYKYPQDLTECHLLGKVKDEVTKTQIKKYLS